MENEKQSPLMEWFDNNRGTHVNERAQDAINLLSSLVVGIGFTSAILNDSSDLDADYINLIKATFGGLYDSGDAENFDEELISDVYTHLTGEKIDDLHAEWAADMDEALAQNRALIAGEQ